MKCYEVLSLQTKCIVSPLRTRSNDPIKTLGINKSETMFSSISRSANSVSIFHPSNMNLCHPDWWLINSLLELLDPLGASSKYSGPAPPSPIQLLSSKALLASLHSRSPSSFFTLFFFTFPTTISSQIMFWCLTWLTHLLGSEYSGTH